METQNVKLVLDAINQFVSNALRMRGSALQLFHPEALFIDLVLNWWRTGNFKALANVRLNGNMQETVQSIGNNQLIFLSGIVAWLDTWRSINLTSGSEDEWDAHCVAADLWVSGRGVTILFGRALFQVHPAWKISNWCPGRLFWPLSWPALKSVPCLCAAPLRVREATPSPKVVNITTRRWPLWWGFSGPHTGLGCDNAGRGHRSFEVRPEWCCLYWRLRRPGWAKEALVLFMLQLTCSRIPQHRGWGYNHDIQLVQG